MTFPEDSAKRTPRFLRASTHSISTRTPLPSPTSQKPSAPTVHLPPLNDPRRRHHRRGRKLSLSPRLALLSCLWALRDVLARAPSLDVCEDGAEPRRRVRLPVIAVERSQGGDEARRRHGRCVDVVRQRPQGGRERRWDWRRVRRWRATQEERDADAEDVDGERPRRQQGKHWRRLLDARDCKKVK